MSRINSDAANLHNSDEFSIEWIMQFVCAGGRVAATHAHNHFIDLNNPNKFEILSPMMCSNELIR